MSFYHVGTIWLKEESLNVPVITMVILLGDQMKTLSDIAQSTSLNLKTAQKQNLSAKDIAQSMYAQCDPDGNTYFLFDSIPNFC